MTEPTPNARTDQPADAAEEQDERQLPTIFEQLGGASGALATVLPVVVFVLLNSVAGLQVAIWSALGSAVLIGVWRLARRERLQPAVSGVLGVGVCALIAYRTGEARGFFLYGIWFSLVAGLGCVVSIVLRWPLIGVLWSAVNSSGFGWRSSHRVLRSYQIATAVWSVFFLARFGVQQWLYDADETGWLGATRLLMGLPLTAVALGLTIWLVRRATRADAEGHRGAAASGG